MAQYTPDGTFNNPIDPATYSDCWIQIADFQNLVDYNADATKQPYLQDYIIMACAMVNRLSNKYWNQQTIDEKIMVKAQSGVMLRNTPIVSISNVWSWEGETFTELDLDTFSVDLNTGYMKSINYLTQNIYVRYVAGYTASNVPSNIKKATSMMVDYLFNTDINKGDVSEFRTQTYSEKLLTGDKSPQFVQVMSLLKPYKKFTLI
jgi:hypothetical protein